MTTAPQLPTPKLAVGNQIVLPTGVRGEIESISEVRPQLADIGIRQADDELVFVRLSV